MTQTPASAAGGAAAMPGFADPVLDGQACFRRVLSAMACPGRLETLAPLPPAPAPLFPATAALALSLFDLETPIWLDRPTDDAAQYLRFHCGCPLTDDRAAAAFAVVTDPATAPTDGYRLGTPDYPDRSATVIVQVAGLSRDGPGARQLSGPGIQDTTTLAAAGLPEVWWQALTAQRPLFPQGIDLILTTRTDLACLPRSTAFREAASCM